jgi:uncharacterized membrane protein YgcG
MAFTPAVQRKLKAINSLKAGILFSRKQISDLEVCPELTSVPLRHNFLVIVPNNTTAQSRFIRSIVSSLVGSNESGSRTGTAGGGGGFGGGRSRVAKANGAEDTDAAELR